MLIDKSGLLFCGFDFHQSIRIALSKLLLFNRYLHICEDSKECPQNGVIDILKKISQTYD